MNKTIELIAVEPSYYCPSEQYIVKGRTFTIHCHINGTNNLEWTFNNTSLRNSTRHLVSEIGLTISKVEISDEGIYNATGLEENTGKSVFRNIYVSVHYPPQFYNYYEEYTYDRGSSAILKCDAMAKPRPTYTWRNNFGHIISSNYSWRMSVDAWGSLHIEDLRSEDAGLYSCVASNNIGFASKDVGLIVLVSNETISRNLTQVNCPSEQFLINGTTSTIRCQFNETKYLRWHFNYTSIKNSTRYLVNEEGLTISKVNISDEGLYQAYGYSENTGGNFVKTVFVSVYYPPQFRYYYEEFTYHQGSSAILRCDAIGNPKPTYNWKNKFGTIINSNFSSKFSVDEWGSLYVYNITLEDAGLYTCEASNEVGYSSKSFRLNVSWNDTVRNETEFSPNLEVVNVTVNSIQMRITSNSSVWFRYYYITFRNQYNTYNKTVRRDFSSDIYMLTDLMPGDAFQVKVAGKNSWYEDNVTEFSREIFVQLLPPSPYLIVNHIYDSSVELEWIPRGAYNTSYGWNGLKSIEIQYQQMTQKNGELYKEQNCEVRIVTKPCAGNTHLIGGLPKPNSNVYIFQVRVENGAGFSDWVSVFIKY
ncbi:contactin-4-like isoform X1 [Tachypleus tridentatus]|uniref:contactin-4-like isoform X1 n=2 Tax=Tachypleus tridentatus TaxID=6853 RepID=UPI003FD1C04E